MRVYAILAFIIVLVPEFFAETIIGLFNISSSKKIRRLSSDWEYKPQLKLSNMTFHELRHFAKDIGLKEYYLKR